MSNHALRQFIHIYLVPNRVASNIHRKNHVRPRPIAKHYLARALMYSDLSYASLPTKYNELITKGMTSLVTVSLCRQDSDVTSYVRIMTNVAVRISSWHVVSSTFKTIWFLTGFQLSRDLYINKLGANLKEFVRRRTIFQTKMIPRLSLATRKHCSIEDPNAAYTAVLELVIIIVFIAVTIVLLL